MISDIAFFNKNYPIDKNVKRHLLLALFLVSWSLVFLWFSEPIDINELGAVSKLRLVPISALMGGCCFSIALVFQNHILNQNKRWTVKNELSFLLIGLTLSFLLLYLYYRLTFGLSSNVYTPLAYLYLVFVPVHIMVLPAIVLGRLALPMFFSKPTKRKAKPDSIRFQGKGKSDLVQLPINEVFYLKSADNYVEIITKSSQKDSPLVLRITLSKLAENHPELIRVHRSYLINPVHFRSFKTTKKGNFLRLSDGSMIPISKSYIQMVRTKLESTTK
ncbi:LytTR family DNA-binding domain-containing protein [Croceitalea dokdonensis]|uniref:LytTR family DNA-binding domain-containing protein n=1 Tax=Croceitalea dokdonensis TaxID=346188 RepID=UPI0006CA3332|nr:LytTR family DNA-binding domain-containing protein [Croceitalea dokdonensis]